MRLGYNYFIFFFEIEINFLKISFAGPSIVRIRTRVDLEEAREVPIGRQLGKRRPFDERQGRYDHCRRGSRRQLANRERLLKSGP